MWNLTRKVSSRFEEINAGTILQTIAHELQTALTVHDPIPTTEEWDAIPGGFLQAEKESSF